MDQSKVFVEVKMLIFRRPGGLSKPQPETIDESKEGTSSSDSSSDDEVDGARSSSGPKQQVTRTNTYADPEGYEEREV